MKKDTSCSSFILHPSSFRRSVSVYGFAADLAGRVGLWHEVGAFVLRAVLVGPSIDHRNLLEVAVRRRRGRRPLQRVRVPQVSLRLLSLEEACEEVDQEDYL